MFSIGMAVAATVFTFGHYLPAWAQKALNLLALALILLFALLHKEP